MTLAAVTISPWIALPLAAVALILIAWHSTGLDRRPMPASRKRIRQANSWVMMLCVPLFAAGVSIVDAETSARAFVLIWTVVGMLVIVSVLLAIVDALNTWRIAAEARRRTAATGEGMLYIAKQAARGKDGSKTPQSDHDD